MKYILAIDQGTTGTTCVLVDAISFEFTHRLSMEHTQIFPKPGEVEHDLAEIWNNTESLISKLLLDNKIPAESIQCIGITNQRETTCAFNKDGTPLYNAIVWQDRRTGAYCDQLKHAHMDSVISAKTGLPVDPYFSASKMNWLLNNIPEIKNANQNGSLLFGTIDTYLLYKLTGHTQFKTEVSNASRTLLMDLESCNWSNELLKIFGINKKSLPVICDSFHEFGKTKGLSSLPDGIPITGILGDQQSALFGQTGVEEGDTKCTYGTGAFMLLNTGNEIKRSNNGLLSTALYRHNGETIYALEGSSYIAGAAVQWLRDNLGIIDESSQIEEFALKVHDLEEMKNLLIFPFFTGIGSPYWRSDAQASILGITRDTNKYHISRAILDGIALSINDLIKTMEEDTGIEITSMRVDGGAVSNNLLMHIQATISQTEIIRPKIIETTAYGAALAAAVGNKSINFSEIKNHWSKDKSFDPKPSELQFYKRKKAQWDTVIKKLYLS